MNTRLWNDFGVEWENWKTDRERGPESICVDDAGAIVYGLVICVAYIDTRTTNIFKSEWEMGNTNFCAW